MLRLMEDVRVVKHCFGRDTADVQTSATKSTSLLNTGGLETELSSLDSSNIPTRSTADDDYVVWFRSRSETTGGLEESKFRDGGSTRKGG